MSTTTASSFDRYAEFERKLNTITEHFSTHLERWDGAIRIKGSRFGSMGVHRLLTNYYKLSAEEQTSAATPGADIGKIRSTGAFKHAIDDTTFLKQFLRVADHKFQRYDENTSVADALHDAGLVPIGAPEFMLGSQNLVVKEFPDSQKLLHLVGAIDHLYYNRLTNKLAIIEKKTSNCRFRNMGLRKIFLKEKNVKQTIMNTFLLLAMATEARVDLGPQSIEVYLAGVELNRGEAQVWKINYDPISFLGSIWAYERWNGIIDNGNLMRVPVKTTINAGVRTQVTPSKPRKRCVCGRIAKKIYRKKPICFDCANEIVASYNSRNGTKIDLFV